MPVPSLESVREALELLLITVGKRVVRTTCEIVPRLSQREGLSERPDEIVPRLQVAVCSIECTEGMDPIVRACSAVTELEEKASVVQGQLDGVLSLKGQHLRL